MTALSKIEVPIKEVTASALLDTWRLEAVGHLIHRRVQLGADDPVNANLERTAAEARGAGLTEDEIEAKLAACNAERRYCYYRVMDQLTHVRNKPADLLRRSQHVRGPIDDAAGSGFP